MRPGPHLNSDSMTLREASRSDSVSNSGTTRSGGEGERPFAGRPLSFSTWETGAG